MLLTRVEDSSLLVVVEVDTLDASNAAEAKTQLNSLDLQGKDRVILNLESVNFIDSSGIGALLSFYKKMGQQVVLRKPTPTVLSVLELLRLHRVFEIEAD